MRRLSFFITEKNIRVEILLDLDGSFDGKLVSFYLSFLFCSMSHSLKPWTLHPSDQAAEQKIVEYHHGFGRHLVGYHAKFLGIALALMSCFSYFSRDCDGFTPSSSHVVRTTSQMFLRNHFLHVPLASRTRIISPSHLVQAPH